jgi:hypothetical protein
MTKVRTLAIVKDVAQGAMGHLTIDFKENDDNPCGLLNSMSLEEWFRFIGALRRRFVDSGAVLPVAFEIYNLHHFETASGAAEHLYQHQAP